MKNSQIPTRTASRLLHKTNLACVLVILTLLPPLLAACAPGGSPTSPAQPASATSTGGTAPSQPTATHQPADTAQGELPFERTARLTPDLLGKIERVPPTQDAPVVGEVPTGLLNEIIADLSERLEISAKEITVVRAEEIVWNDGSLGCPKPGEFYTQALVNGYHVILRVDSQDYDYRASQRGTFFLCEHAIDLTPPQQ